MNGLMPGVSDEQVHTAADKWTSYFTDQDQRVRFVADTLTPDMVADIAGAGVTSWYVSDDRLNVHCTDTPPRGMSPGGNAFAKPDPEADRRHERAQQDGHPD